MMKASNTAYGTRKGNRWVRTVTFKRHFFRKYKGFGFHPHFRQTFQDDTLEGCEIQATDTGQAWYITRTDWLDNAQYVKDPRPQYVVPLSAFTQTSTGTEQVRKRREATMSDRMERYRLDLEERVNAYNGKSNGKTITPNQ